MMEVEMKKIIYGYKTLMSYLGVLGLMGFIACVLIQVISRTFLPTAPNWTEEGARYLFIYMVAFAGNAAVISDEYVGVDLLLELFPEAVRKGIRLVTQIVLCVFSIFIFYNCVIGPDGLLAVTPPTMVSTALELPMKNVYFALVVLFGCYVISYLFRIYLMLTKKEEV